MEEKLGAARPHRLTIQDRKLAGITGVSDCVSFDENEVVLDTDMGLLTIRGKDLHVNRLTLEKGRWIWKGRWKALSTAPTRPCAGPGNLFLPGSLSRGGSVLSERIYYELLLTASA